MSINIDFYAPTYTARDANGVELCTVRGLTPNDIARIVNEHAEEVEQVMEAFERDDAVSSALQGGEVSAAVEALTAPAFTRLVSTVPTLAAKIIAIAADEPSLWGHVHKHFVLPVQFNILVEIARLTFIDKNGFKEFLGNVLALVGSGNRNDQRLPEQSNQSTSNTAG